MSAPSVTHQNLEIPLAGVVLEADLGMPKTPRGAVLFAHSSGSGRHSPRNRFVAAELNRAGLATVLADLLTPREEQLDLRTAALRFDIDLLAGRITRLSDWTAHAEPTAGLGTGLFGASTGAAAALIAAANRPATVQAVVSRGGRPDLADAHLHQVHQPTLLIVGQSDPVVIELNRQAMRKLDGPSRLEIIPSASHLFEEPGNPTFGCTSRTTTSAQGEAMTVKLNQRGFDHARDLVVAGRYVIDERDAWSEHQPSTQQENEFIRQHGIGEYAKWHLGIDDQQDSENKGRYKFPYGDLEKVHRCGLLAAESRAGQRKYYDIELAVAHLHGMLEAVRLTT